MSARYCIKTIFLFFLLCSSFGVSGDNFTLVLDAGHGGKDFGASGNKAYEKDVNLAVVREVGRLVENNLKDIDVVYTRKNDTYLTLKDRAAIANKAEGDLFISIHTNSIAKKNKKRKTINGAATYTLGLHKSDENLDVAMRENSVIELEKDYTKSYKGFDPNIAESYIIFEISQQQHLEQSIAFASLVQNELHTTAGRKNNGVRQAGFWVLFATSMPAVLIELDFICNPTVEQFLASSSGQKKLARAIYNSIKQYKKNIDIKINQIRNNNASDGKAKNDGRNQVVYRVQYYTSEKRLNDNNVYLCGLKPSFVYKDNGLYKYTYGAAVDFEEAKSILKDVRRKFKTAFIVKFKNNKRIK